MENGIFIIVSKLYIAIEYLVGICIRYIKTFEGLMQRFLIDFDKH